MDIRGTAGFGFIFSTYAGCALCGHHFCFAFLGLLELFGSCYDLAFQISLHNEMFYSLF